MIRASVVLAAGLIVQTGATTGVPAIERYRVGPVVLGADAQKLDQTGPGGSELWRVRDPARVSDSVTITSVLLTR